MRDLPESNQEMLDAFRRDGSCEQALRNKLARIEALEAAGKRLAEAVRAFLEMDDPDDMAAGNTDSVIIITMHAQALGMALAAWRAADGGEDE